MHSIHSFVAGGSYLNGGAGGVFSVQTNGGGEHAGGSHVEDEGGSRSCEKGDSRSDNKGGSKFSNEFKARREVSNPLPYDKASGIEDERHVCNDEPEKMFLSVIGEMAGRLCL